MSKIEMDDTGRDIRLLAIKIVMPYRAPRTIMEAGSRIRDTEYNIIINLQPTDGTPRVLVIKRDS